MQKNAYKFKRAATVGQLDHCLAVVTSVNGTRCVLDYEGGQHSAFVATHVPALVVGQRVAFLNGGTDTTCLVVAAWPLAGHPAEPLLNFDASTGTLRIQAARLNLQALAMVELTCGETRIRLSLDGKVRIEGAEILSAAIGSNRIEGASIDLN